MKNNNKQFPKTLEAFEVEQGINTNFNLCIEIANRYNNHDKLIEALKEFHEMFVHKEGESEKNKVKTNMIKYCDEVKNALNNSRELLQSIEQQ